MDLFALCMITSSDATMILCPKEDAHRKRLLCTGRASLPPAFYVEYSRLLGQESFKY
jgi:hypothetical protein